MNITEIKDKNRWDAFLRDRRFPEFLQSSRWLDFQEGRAEKVFRLGVEDENGKLVAAAGLILYSTPLKRGYFYCPRGPVLDRNIPDKEKVLVGLLKNIEELARKEKAIFLRLESNFNLPADLGWKVEPTIEIQPGKTLVLDLTNSEEELMKQMHQKTRYNIRLAFKKGVTTRDGNQKDFEQFWRLMEQTGQRDNFRTHPESYYKKMLEQGGDMIKLKLAEYQGEVVAAGLFAFFGKVVWYMHGASSYEHRKVMAPYALQWSAIEEAKAGGFKYYDFHGVNPDKWPGVTRFKKGFGGTELNYPGTKDLVFEKKWYNVYKVLRYIRRKIRNPKS